MDRKKSVAVVVAAICVVFVLYSVVTPQTWSKPHQDSPDVRVMYRGTLSGSEVIVLRVHDTEFLMTDGRKNILMIPPKCPPGLAYESWPATTDEMDEPETRPRPRLRYVPDPEELEERPMLRSRPPEPKPMPEPDKEI